MIVRKMISVEEEIYSSIKFLANKKGMKVMAYVGKALEEHAHKNQHLLEGQK